jgi:hypothetical protein
MIIGRAPEYFGCPDNMAPEILSGNKFPFLLMDTIAWYFHNQIA